MSSSAGASPGGETVTVRRQLPLERLSDFPTVGPVSIADLNAELSRLIALIQDVYAGYPAAAVPLVSGRFTPAQIALVNCSLPTGVSRFVYSRVGNIVTCSFWTSVDIVTAGISTSFRLSLPFATQIATADLNGVAVLATPTCRSGRPALQRGPARCPRRTPPPTNRATRITRFT